MNPLVLATKPHRRRHRRQNAQFFGFFEVDKDAAATTSVTAKSPPATNTPDINTDSIVTSGPKTSPRQQRHNPYSQAFSQETNATKCTTTNISHDLMQWRFSRRYLTNAPVSPHSKTRHTCSLGSITEEDGNEDSWAQGVTQLSQLYANGRYKKERGEFITEDYFFRNDEGTWNHLEWHSRQ